MKQDEERVRGRFVFAEYQMQEKGEKNKYFLGVERYTRGDLFKELEGVDGTIETLPVGTKMSSLPVGSFRIPKSTSKESKTFKCFVPSTGIVTKKARRDTWTHKCQPKHFLQKDYDYAAIAYENQFSRQNCERVYQAALKEAAKKKRAKKEN